MEEIRPLHAVKQRSAQSHGQTQHSTFHDAANGVTLRLGGGDPARMVSPTASSHHREWLVLPWKRSKE